MILKLASSTQSMFFKNTVVAFSVDGERIVCIQSEEDEELTLVCLVKAVIQQMQPRDLLEIRSLPNTLSRPFEEGWYDNWIATDFKTKKKNPNDWRALKKSFDEKGIHRPIIGRNDPATLANLKDAIHEERTGRKTQTPHVPRPGEPDENPWAKRDETLEDYLARRAGKD